MREPVTTTSCTAAGVASPGDWAKAGPPNASMLTVPARAALSVSLNTIAVPLLRLVVVRRAGAVVLGFGLR
jgi:hypothetical protein